MSRSHDEMSPRHGLGWSRAVKALQKKSSCPRYLPTGNFYTPIFLYMEANLNLVTIRLWPNVAMPFSSLAHVDMQAMIHERFSLLRKLYFPDELRSDYVICSLPLKPVKSIAITPSATFLCAGPWSWHGYSRCLSRLRGS